MFNKGSDVGYLLGGAIAISAIGIAKLIGIIRKAIIKNKQEKDLENKIISGYNDYKLLQEIKIIMIDEIKAIADFVKYSGDVVGSQKKEELRDAYNAIKAIRGWKTLDDAKRSWVFRRYECREVLRHIDQYLEIKNRLIQSGKLRTNGVRDSRRMITMNHMPWAFGDAGVKGMKKGQHVMAKDPDYVESLKGGGGSQNSSNPSTQNKVKKTPQEMKKIQRKENIKRVGLGVATGAALGAGLLGTIKLASKIGPRIY